MAERTVGLPAADPPSSMIPTWNSDALREIPASRGSEGKKDIEINELSLRIREEHSLFWSFLQAVHERNDKGNVITAELLKKAMLHRQMLGELLLSVRRGFNTKENWEQWVRDQCLMDQSIANDYMQLAKNAKHEQP